MEEKETQGRDENLFTMRKQVLIDSINLITSIPAHKRT